MSHAANPVGSWELAMSVPRVVGESGRVAWSWWKRVRNRAERDGAMCARTRNVGLLHARVESRVRGSLLLFDVIKRMVALQKVGNSGTTAVSMGLCTHFVKEKEL